MAIQQASIGSPGYQLPQQQTETRLRGSRLLLARLAWCILVTLVLALFFVSLPTYLTHLQTPCRQQPCAYLQLTADGVRSLQSLGISLAGYTAITLAFTLGSALVWIITAGVLAWRRSDDWMALLVAFMLIVGGAGNALNIGATVSQMGWQMPANLLGFLNGLAVVAVLTLFPSGRFAPRWSGCLILTFLLVSFPHQFFADWEARLPAWVNIFGLLDFGGSLLLLVLAQIYRYWRVSTSVQRQQTKWILFSLGVGVLGFVVGGVIQRYVPSLNGSLYDPINAYVNAVASLFLPIAFAIAILRYQLWDIDLIINRSLVYGALTACVIGCYILVVGYLGAIFRTGGNLLISLMATGLVAVLFQPLRIWLQRGVNRLMYGQRDEPYAVVAQLGRRLETTLATEAVLPTVVETLALALKLPYAAIALRQGEAFTTVANYGAPVEGTLTLPLTYQQESVGQLTLGPRQRGESFTPTDRRLLEDLARQIGVAAHAVRLAGDLQRSRERLVTAREEERRRLRRDLHDGLGPTLGSLTLQLDTARNLLKNDPAAADEALVDLKAQVQAALTDIRRLVYELRPPTLDELGLVSALCEQANRYQTPNLSITLTTPEQLPPLPAAVEVAIYRIAQEALTNVARHASAHRCALTLTVGAEISLEVCDDGQGLPAHYSAGVGLISMRERATELGGSCVIGAANQGGTRIVVRIPLVKEG